MWESLLGPPKAPEIQEPEASALSFDAFRNQPDTPSLQPDYSQPIYNPSQADPAKRQLFQQQAAKKQVAADVWKKVTNLGNPYEVRDSEKTLASSGKNPEASLKYLSAKTSAPFFAAAIADSNLPLNFPAEEDEEPELGIASRAPPKDPPRPLIPVVKDLKNTIRKLQTSRNVQRLQWHSRNFPAPADAESEFFQSTQVPKACWQQMREDAFSWCEPDKQPPAGREGARVSKSCNSVSLASFQGKTL